MTGAQPPGSGRRCLGPFCALLLVALTCTSAANLCAQEPLRIQPVDESSVQVPPGWKSIDRALYDAYAAAMSAGPRGQNAAGLKRGRYQLALQADGSLIGEFEGTMSLIGEPAIVPLGKPSFAMSDVLLDGERALFGTDPQGAFCVQCPRDAA